MNDETTLRAHPGFWAALERLGTESAVAATWRSLLGDELWPAVCNTLLEPQSEVAGWYPCPRQCGCRHEVIRHGADDVVAVCRCEPWRCDAIPIKPEDLLLWQIGWHRLGARLCRALSLESRPVDLGFRGTRQIGAWSAGLVPVILALERGTEAFELVASQAAARLRRPLLLLTPTARWVTATLLERLNGFGAEVIPLDRHVSFLPSGVLHANRSAGELFAKFTPEPDEQADEEVARRAFAMVQALGAETGQRKAAATAVFRLFCIEGLSVAQIARHCRCARSLVYLRLQQLRRKLKRDPAEFRRYSAHLERIDTSLSDNRARRIWRQGDPREM